MYNNYSKEYWLEEINNTSDVIIQAMTELNNISLLSSLVLPKLRVLVDSIACYIREDEVKVEINETSYEKIDKSISYVLSKNNYKFLAKLHDEFNISNHHTAVGDYATRLLYSYLLELINIKDFVYRKYNIEILNGIENFTIDKDDTFNDYYKKILYQLNKCHFSDNPFTGGDYYYVQKKKPIYIDHSLFFEYTLTNALDHNNKFDRFVVFSKLNLYENYAIQGKILNKSISIFQKNVNITILTDYNVSIRLCELEHLGNILGGDSQYSKTKEYYKLMKFIQSKRISLSQIILFDDNKYFNFEKECFDNDKPFAIQSLLRKVREFVKTKRTGTNVLLYLLTIMRNDIIKKQIDKEPNVDFYGLKLKMKCKPFDQTPYSASLCQHIPLMRFIMECISYDDHYYEMLNRVVSKNSLEENALYTPVDELKFDKDIDEVIEKYNSTIPSYHPLRKIYRYNKYVYLEENESDTSYLLKLIKTLIHNGGLSNYYEYVNKNIAKLEKADAEKIKVIQKMYNNNSLFAIYGPAGTGKSTLANYIANILDDFSVLCLANTNPAVENLKHKIEKDNVEFSTVHSFVNDKYCCTKYDLLIIDECSTISTKDIYSIFAKIDCKAIIIMGDVFQIEAIKFGNWFGLLRFFLPKDSYVDLSNQHRTKNQILLDLWQNVRNLEIQKVRSSLSYNKISHELNEDVLIPKDKDEIILCLNYDGIFGINNINKLLQLNNETETVVSWKHYIFKKGDPILFLENRRFNNILYNNLKGRIEDVREDKLSIYFTLKVSRHIDNIYGQLGYFTLISSDLNESLISFKVNKYSNDSYDRDSDEMNKIPFQIAYAVSIHKAQGLEFNSVKVIIPNEIDENISLNIFYTAITRAKEKLQIYWTKESQEKILQSFEKKNFSRDANIIKGKFPDLKIK